MSIATADLTTQTTETLAGLLDTMRKGSQRNLVIDLLAERGAITAPTAYDELMINDIVTFGGRRTEWIVTEHEGRTLLVRQIKGSQIGQLLLLVEGDTRVWRVL